MLLYSVLFVELDLKITAAKSTLLHIMSFRPATANDIYCGDLLMVYSCIKVIIAQYRNSVKSTQ